jgi:hypothetical protein
MNVELKLLLQLLLCGFDICLFLFDRTAKIDSTEVSTCQGSFGGFKSTCFQLDRAARIKTTRISYFSCNSSPLYPGMWECVGQIPAKLGHDEKLLNEKSGKPSQN